MAHQLTIQVGELFAEVSDSSGLRERWFLPKKTLTDGIREKVKGTYDKALVQIVHRADAFPADRFTENKIAVLVTAGFEGLIAQFFSERDLSLKNDFIFKLNERVSSEGKVEQRISTEECLAYSEKLKTLKIEEAIVVTINADLNSENQSAAVAVLRDQGLKVHASNKQIKNLNTRCLALIDSVQRQHLIEDLESQLSELKKTISVVEFEDFKIGHDAEFYAGFDHFFTSNNGELKSIDSQPTDTVDVGFFDAPEFHSLPAPLRNGPLLLGKSLRPTALDLMILSDRSITIDGINETHYDRMKNRIEEALVIMSKGQVPSGRIEGAKVAADSLEIFFTALKAELKNIFGSREFSVTGPLSDYLTKNLNSDSTLKCKKIGAGR